jgi:hypothetical protein
MDENQLSEWLAHFKVSNVANVSWASLWFQVTMCAE